MESAPRSLASISIVEKRFLQDILDDSSRLLEIHRLLWWLRFPRRVPRLTSRYFSRVGRSMEPLSLVVEQYPAFAIDMPRPRSIRCASMPKIRKFALPCLASQIDQSFE